jgi:phospholipid/cholesterol/gamma-HCH transport system substrate-binding protein
MTERQMQFRIGALVLAAILLFMGFVLSVGRRSALFEERYTLWASFASSEGLAVGAPVRVAGVTVGTVSRIAFAQDKAVGNIVLTLSLERRVQEQIRQDSVASIGTQGLLGDKVLDVTVGSQNLPVLNPGERLNSQEPVDYGQLLKKGDRILDHVTSITSSLDQFLAGKDPEVGKQNLGEALRSLRTSLVELEKGQGVLHELIYGRAGTASLANLDRTTARLERLMAAIEGGDGLLHGLIYQPQGDTLTRLRGATGQLEASLQEARGVAQEMRTLVRDVREGTGLLHALVYDPELPASLKGLGADSREAVNRLSRQGEETLQRLGREGEAFLRQLGQRSEGTLAKLEQAAGRVDELVRSVERGEGLLPALLFDPSRKQVLVDLQAAAAGVREASTDLQRLVDEVAEGEGTLGGLIKDPTVYEDVSSLLRGANRSRLLRWLIRSTRERGGEAAEAPAD